MFSFNNESEQKTVGGGAIPAKSMVKVKFTIRQPEQGKGSQVGPLVTTFTTGLMGLDCEFEVVSGQFEGSKIWENFFLPPAMQNPTLKLTKGQEGICQGCGAKMRAILEAARGIHPADGSPGSVQARGINGFEDFQGMEFGIMVGIDKPKAGDKYINNNIMRVITCDKEEYPNLMQGGDIITDMPLPEIPGGTAQANTKGATQAGYSPPANNQAQTNTQGTTQTGYTPPTQNQGAGGQPSWSQQNHQGGQQMIDNDIPF